MDIAYIIALSKDKTHAIIEKILDYKIIDDNRIYITDIRSELHFISNNQLIAADFNKAISNIGTCYRIAIKHTKSII